MQRLTSRITVIAKASSSLRTILLNEAPSSSSSWLPNRSFSAFSLQQLVQNPEKEAIPGELLKWGSLGFCRTSRFASGFTPLEPKPLDSIMDLNRAKNRSPEDLASIWDDYHLGRGHIGLTMKAKLYRLLKQRGSDCRYFVISLWRGSGYTTMFTQGVKCCCYTCFSLVLRIIKQEELKQLLTSLHPFTQTLQKARTWYSFVEILFSPASLVMMKRSGSWKPLYLFI